MGETGIFATIDAAARKISEAWARSPDAEYKCWPGPPEPRSKTRRIAAASSVLPCLRGSARNALRYLPARIDGIGLEDVADDLLLPRAELERLAGEIAGMGQRINQVDGLISRRR